ncbi:MAG TPA: EAL domain-containing protein, partial [Duganella sp.]|uniref:EAL domain-containing protein n=1 Tax=Duganella sp. TaxID=1904440 RepID=UPI002ED4BA36
PVGAWALATAAAQARHWMDRGHPLTVSVHLSPRQFYQKDIAESLAAILERAGVPGPLIELEITEGMLIDRNQNCEGTLRRLKELGVRISISDFGTGYASLNYLRRFPVDVVKIDKSFIDDLHGTRRPPDTQGGAKRTADGSMVRAIIAMAHTLDMRVLAGGVETGDQLARLMAMDCDEAFGFCLSAAMPPGEVEALLASRDLITS